MAPYVPRNSIVRERGLLYGTPGSGKSNALITIMRRQVDDFFYVLDTEDDWEFSLSEDEGNEELLNRGNFKILTTEDNKDYEETLEKLVEIRTDIKRGEWFFYDKMTPAWQAAQDWYSHEVFGVDQADYIIQSRKLLEEKRTKQIADGGKGDRTAPVFDQLRDWGPINAQYNRIEREYKKISTVAHTFIVADLKALGDNTPPAKVKMYRPFGGMPAGQGGIDVHPHTILHMSYDDRDEEYSISTVKDRGSRRKKKVRLDETPWVDFSVTYLRDVGMWGPRDGEAASGKKKGKK